MNAVDQLCPRCNTKRTALDCHLCTELRSVAQDDRPSAQPAAQRAPQADTPANGADQQDTTPGVDSAAATTLSLTVPEGVEAGQQLQIEAPDGRTLLITVPEGVTAGQQLEVSV